VTDALKLQKMTLMIMSVYFWISNRSSITTGTHCYFPVVRVRLFKKSLIGFVLSNRIVMKFGKIVLQVNARWFMLSCASCVKCREQVKKKSWSPNGFELQTTSFVAVRDILTDRALSTLSSFPLE